MNLFTIGFTQKTARIFFETLIAQNIDCLLDIRLNNSSQLAGFSKGADLEYFLEKFTDIKYIHNISFAPTKDILDNYKKNKLTWKEYEILYNKLLSERNVEKIFKEDILFKNFNNVCLLCSEASAECCHRRLLAEYLKKNLADVNIIHL